MLYVRDIETGNMIDSLNIQDYSLVTVPESIPEFGIFVMTKLQAQ